MVQINFGTGPNTSTGDTVSSALAKLQARLDALITAPVVAPLRQIASRSGPATHQAPAGSSKAFGRTSHFATSDLTQLQVVFTNWVQFAGNAEADVNGATTIEWIIEYPRDTLNRVKFSGANSAAVASGAKLISDVLTITIPRGAEFWERVLLTNANGVPYRLMDSSGGVADKNYCNMTNDAAPAAQFLQTGLGGAAYAGGGNVLCASALVAPSNDAAVGILGDSRTAAGPSLASPFDAATGENGAVRPGLKNIAYIDFARQSMISDNFLAAAATRRIAHLAPYVSVIFDATGINDLTVGKTSAQLLANKQQLKADWGAKPFYLQTIEPKSLSTNGWVDVAGQTAENTETARLAFNAAVRDGLGWVAAFIDAAAVTESALNSGKWAAGYTSDGLHDNANGYNAQKTAAIFKPTVFGGIGNPGGAGDVYVPPSAPFTMAGLFSAQQKGAYYDFTDRTKLKRNADGTNGTDGDPVVGGTARWAIDLSPNGNHLRNTVNSVAVLANGIQTPGVVGQYGLFNMAGFGDWPVIAQPWELIVTLERVGVAGANHPLISQGSGLGLQEKDAATVHGVDGGAGVDHAVPTGVEFTFHMVGSNSGSAGTALSNEAIAYAGFAGNNFDALLIGGDNNNGSKVRVKRLYIRQGILTDAQRAGVVAWASA